MSGLVLKRHSYNPAQLVKIPGNDLDEGEYRYDPILEYYPPSFL